MTVAVDTNILIDILNKDERHFEFSFLRRVQGTKGGIS
jgi:predicted nucleic acid-binding protein